jgi:hypothetical protein
MANSFILVKAARAHLTAGPDLCMQTGQMSGAESTHNAGLPGVGREQYPLSDPEPRWAAGYIPILAAYTESTVICC